MPKIPKPDTSRARRTDPPGRTDAPSCSTSTNDLVWGIHPVLELLKNRPRQIREITVQKSKTGAKLQEIIQFARRNNIKLRFASRLNVPGPGRVSHQGVVAGVTPYATVTLEELLDKVRRTSSPSVLVALDSIQDPHNLGSIVRSASAAGAAGVIMGKDRSAPLSGTAAKASAGALSHMDVCVTTNLAVALKRLQEEGFWVYGADMDGDSMYRADFSGPVCLVIGGEGKGIRPLVKKQCDFLVSIPMHGSLDSLNASVAASVILFEIVRKRQLEEADSSRIE